MAISVLEDFFLKEWTRLGTRSGGPSGGNGDDSFELLGEGIVSNGGVYPGEGDRFFPVVLRVGMGGAPEMIGTWPDS